VLNERAVLTLDLEGRRWKLGGDLQYGEGGRSRHRVAVETQGCGPSRVGWGRTFLPTS